jgi:hypothetical protein
MAEWRYTSNILEWPASPPSKQPPVPTRQEAGWAPEPVWMLWCRDKSLVPAVQTVSTPTLRTTIQILKMKTTERVLYARCTMAANLSLSFLLSGRTVLTGA